MVSTRPPSTSSPGAPGGFPGILALASHGAYCDESNYNTGAFPSIAILSLRECDRDEIERTTTEIIRIAGLKELKWKQLDSANACKGAIAVAKYIVSLARVGRLRVDV